MALRSLTKRRYPPASITLIDPDTSSVYSGMVPGFVAGHFKQNEIEVDLKRLCSNAGVQFLQDEICALNLKRKQFEGRSGAVYDFDVTSINIGVTSIPPDTCASPSSTPVKPMRKFVDQWLEMRHDLSKGMAIIGGGLGGVELCLAIRHYARTSGIPDDVPITVIDRSEILGSAASSLKKSLARKLSEFRIGVLENTSAHAITPDGVRVSSGETVKAGQIVWATGAHAANWLEESGLATDNGFPMVLPTLQSVSHDSVFLAGDTAHFMGESIPKAGVYAVRQGQLLMSNLIAFMSGNSLRSFQPQTDYLKLVSLGGKSAIAEKWGHTLKAPGLWSLKKIIDQSFVRG